MKKVTLISIVFCALTIQLSAQKLTPIQLSGQVGTTATGKVYLEKYENKLFKKIDSTTLVNGSFQFKTPVELPELYGISLEGQEYPYQVFLEEGPIRLEIGESNKSVAIRVTGSKSQERYESFRNRQRSLTAEQFIKEDPSSIVSAFVLFRNFSYDLTPQEIQKHIGLLSPSLKKSQYVQILDGLVERQSAVLPGKKALDFVSKNPQGETVRFFDHLGKGYVLLDFWAAWCGPCRRENPNIVAAFQKYKDKGFTVFGVSLDKNKESWVKAIADDKLDWAQVSDLAFWNTEAAALYGVRFIPSNLLIDPNGIIVARNIKGEDLQKKLQEIFGE